MSEKTSSFREVTPLDLFRRLSRVYAVTGAENRAYSSLLSHWLDVSQERAKAHRPGSQQRDQTLRARFIGAQLLVEWTGDTTSRRRLIMIAHTDREGYVLGPEFARADGTLRILGRQPDPRPWPVEPFRKDVKVWVVGGRGEDTRRVEGFIESINVDLRGKDDPGAVVVAVQPSDAAERVIEHLSGPCGTVCAIHRFEDLEGKSPDDGVWVTPGDEIHCAYVDNAAGVAVATAALTHMVLQGAPINATIAYTTGEEAEFTGLLDLLLLHRDEIANDLYDMHDLLWLVIDSSDVTQSFRTSIENWQMWRSDAHPAKTGEAAAKLSPEQKMIRCDISCSAVRCGDKVSDFDLQATRLLYQAALEARSWFDHEAVITLMGRQTNQFLAPLLAPVSPQLLGICGVFKGGKCEATILCHIQDLLSNGKRLLVGSIAIPINNYRGIKSVIPDDILGVASHQPEVTHLGALNSAFLIIQKACVLHMGCNYPPTPTGESIAGFREKRGLTKGFNTRKEFVDDLQRIMNGRCVVSDDATRLWIRDRGSEMARGVF